MVKVKIKQTRYTYYDRSTRQLHDDYVWGRHTAGYLRDILRAQNPNYVLLEILETVEKEYILDAERALVEGLMEVNDNDNQ